jgi:hypothetical protein
MSIRNKLLNTYSLRDTSCTPGHHDAQISNLILLLLGNSDIELLHPRRGSLNVHGVGSLVHGPLQKGDVLAELAVFLDESVAQIFQFGDTSFEGGGGKPMLIHRLDES